MSIVCCSGPNFDYFFLDQLIFRNQVVQGFWNGVTKCVEGVARLYQVNIHFFQDQRVAFDSIMKNSIYSWQK